MQSEFKKKVKCNIRFYICKHSITISYLSRYYNCGRDYKLWLNILTQVRASLTVATNKFNINREITFLHNISKESISCKAASTVFKPTRISNKMHQLN